MQFAVQYLEGGHDWSGVSAEAARKHLRAASSRLPIALVALGWDIPDRLVEACAGESARLGIKLYRWQPLLTSDGTFLPGPEWQVVNLEGNPVVGFAGMPEFTFVCPNRPAVHQALFERVQHLIQTGIYQGLFLDRIRFPSPAASLWNGLACFCPDCQRRAAEAGLDLEAAGDAVRDLIVTPEGGLSLVQRLLTTHPSPGTDPHLRAVDALLDFRQSSITHLVQAVAELARSRGLSIGLDAFSPCLTRMVGQDLTALDGCCDWIKIMTYSRTLGPAGLPFELGGLAEWLALRYRLGDEVILKALAEAVGFHLPLTRHALRQEGLATEAIQTEVHQGRMLGVSKLLGGLALVEMPKVNEMSDSQVQEVAAAFLHSGADGLVISWDLWHVPLERLDLLRTSAS